MIISLAIVVIIVVASSVWITNKPNNYVSALESLEKAESILNENYTGEFILLEFGSWKLDKSGNSSGWEFRYWFNNGSSNGNIRITIFSNNTAYKTDDIYPFNQTLWDAISSGDIIDGPVIDSNQVFEVILAYLLTRGVQRTGYYLYIIL